MVKIWCYKGGFYTLWAAKLKPNTENETVRCSICVWCCNSFPEVSFDGFGSTIRSISQRVKVLLSFAVFYLPQSMEILIVQSDFPWLSTVKLLLAGLLSDTLKTHDMYNFRLFFHIFVSNLYFREHTGFPQLAGWFTFNIWPDLNYFSVIYRSLWLTNCINWHFSSSPLP